jgi:hypothetical protein
MKSVFTTTLAVTLALISWQSCDIRNEENKTANAPNNPVKKIDTSARAKPTTVRILDSLYDFKQVKEGEEVKFSFRFENTGTNPLVIEEAIASCGCTVPEKPEDPIMPGETGVIKAVFKTDKRPGQAEKTITVTSNAIPEFPRLIIKGTVIGKEQ